MLVDPATIVASPCTARRRRSSASNDADASPDTTAPSIVSFQVDWERKLGSGSFGATFVAQGDSSVAIKVLHPTSQDELDKAVRESACLEMLQHPNICAVLSHGPVGSDYHIAMERAAGGELFDRVASFPLPSENTARTLFCELLDAVGHCHSRGVAHRDIKLENVLLTEGGSVKLIDFGLAHQYLPAHEGHWLIHGGWDRSIPLTDCVGSQSYIAPEVIAGEGYDGFTADMWSCGVVLFALLAGAFPYDSEPPATIDARRCPGGQRLPEEAVGLVEALLEVEPARRPSAHAARRHGWCTGDGNGFAAEEAGEALVDVQAMLEEVLGWEGEQGTQAGAGDESLASLALDSYLATLEAESFRAEDAAALWDSSGSLEDGVAAEEASRGDSERCVSSGGSQKRPRRPSFGEQLLPSPRRGCHGLDG